ncbi:MAG: transporter [Nitrospirota bacterium]|nr:transporter [Nitrospirota bacterium]
MKETRSYPYTNNTIKIKTRISSPCTRIAESKNFERTEEQSCLKKRIKTINTPVDSGHGKRFFYAMVWLLTIAIYTPVPVSASEGGGSAYPNGAEGFFAGVVPPPGQYLINYFSYYRADRLNDAAGNKLPLDFKLSVTANTLRYIHITDKKILGGFWGWHVLLPILNVDVEVGGNTDKKTGLGDIIISPLVLSWHSPSFHYAVGLDFYLPTGSYDKNALANTSRNYYTFEPVLVGTYLAENGFQTSAKFMYDVNTENKDTRYKTGQEFHFDYTLAKTIDPWSFGVGGYYYEQITDDERNGIKIGNRGKTIALGPQVFYGTKDWSFSLKWHHEVETINRPEGNWLWFKFIFSQLNV